MANSDICPQCSKFWNQCKCPQTLNDKMITRINELEEAKDEYANLLIEAIGILEEQELNLSCSCGKPNPRVISLINAAHKALLHAKGKRC